MPSDHDHWLRAHAYASFVHSADRLIGERCPVHPIVLAILLGVPGKGSRRTSFSRVSPLDKLLVAGEILTYHR